MNGFRAARTQLRTFMSLLLSGYWKGCYQVGMPRSPIDEGRAGAPSPGGREAWVGEGSGVRGSAVGEGTPCALPFSIPVQRTVAICAI